MILVTVFTMSSDLSSFARLDSRWRLSLQGFRSWIRGLMAQALQHGQAWILGEPGVSGRELAHVESGSAVGADFTHVHALGTQAYLRELASLMCIEVAHYDRIAPRSAVERRTGTA